jgi:hypothetical protein
MWQRLIEVVVHPASVNICAGNPCSPWLSLVCCQSVTVGNSLGHVKMLCSGKRMFLIRPFQVALPGFSPFSSVWGLMNTTLFWSSHDPVTVHQCQYTQDTSSAFHPNTREQSQLQFVFSPLWRYHNVWVLRPGKPNVMSLYVFWERKGRVDKQRYEK